MEENSFHQEDGESVMQHIDCEDAPLIAERQSHWTVLAVRYHTTRKCISSKAALLILFWSFTVALANGLVANPDTFTQMFPITITLVAYGASYFGLIMFYPLAGFLADVKFSRYKTVLRSLYLIVLFLFIFIVAAGIGAALLVIDSVPSLVIGIIICSIGGLAFFVILFGFVGFTANIIPFGMDQLHRSPGEDRTLFIHWYVWIYYVSVFVTQLSWNLPFGYTLQNLACPSCYTGMILCGAILVGVSIASVCLGYHKQRWLILLNPRPVYHNTITDTGHVKAILKVLFTFGMVSFLDFGANSTLPLFALHNIQSFPIEDHNTQLVQEILINKGVLSPLLVVVCIPLYLFLLRPFISYYIPGMLKRMGIGMCLVLLSLMLTFSLDTATHNMHKNSLCMFKDNFDTSPPLHTTFNNVLVVQNILSALSNMLTYIAVFEFICSQSPHSMKGLLIGLWYAIQGLYRMFAAALTVPYIFWSERLPSCGFGYYLMNIVVGVFAVLVYVCVARRYKYRERDEPSPSGPDYDPRVEP